MLGVRLMKLVHADGSNLDAGFLLSFESLYPEV